jgi:D-alanyl-D-alanine carboxypeptidase
MKPLLVVRSRWLFAGACFSMLVAGPQAAFAHRSSARPVSELLVDAANGTVIFAAQPDALQRPASLTKMMALYLVFDALEAGRIKLGDALTFSRKAARQQPSKLGIAAGKTLSVRDAVQAMAVHSANDVTVAMAERLGGSESKFAALMTVKARQLGMSKTHFANASGLTSPGNQTTARDMTILALALLRNHPREYAVFGTRSIIWRKRRIANHDHLLGRVQGVDGIKTGYTVDAGYNIATSAKRRGVRVIAVVLGAKSIQGRDLRVAHLVELGFARGSGGPRRHGAS